MIHCPSIATCFSIQAERVSETIIRRLQPHLVRLIQIHSNVFVDCGIDMIGLY
jgi:hypothetical protein